MDIHTFSFIFALTDYAFLVPHADGYKMATMQFV
jgi:hypothetical protein